MPASTTPDDVGVFFAPIPEPDGEPNEPPTHVYCSSPGREPENWLRGVAALGVQLVRTATTAVFLTCRRAYPAGLALTLDARVSPDDLLPDAEFVGNPRDRQTFIGGLRLGMQWSDGTKIETEDRWLPRRQPNDDRIHPTPTGGGGGGIRFAWELLLWPLPPPEPVDVVIVWLARGIPETSVSVDLAPLVRAASSAVELWPLAEQPRPPSEGGWFAYAPLSPDRP